MTDGQALIHLQRMADLDYQAVDLLIKRVKQFNRIKEILEDDSVSQMYEHQKLMEVINE